MFESSTTEQIMDALSPLVEADRLSGKVLIDGVLLVDSDAQAVVELITSDYDEWGFSPHDEFGCVTIQVVNDRIFEWVNSGNEFKQKVAEMQAQFFGILIPGRDYDSDVHRLVKRNFAYHAIMSGYFNKFVVDQFRHYNPLYRHLETGELREGLGADVKRSDWGRNPNYQGDVIPNHSSVSWGNFASPKHRRWASRFAAGIGPYILAKMDRRLKSLEHTQLGAPNFDPFISV